MKLPRAFPRLKGYRFAREIVAYAVWACHLFVLSAAAEEYLLAERGVTVGRETVRLWINRFGRHFATCIRRDRPRSNAALMFGQPYHGRGFAGGMVRYVSLLFRLQPDDRNIIHYRSTAAGCCGVLEICDGRKTSNA